MPQTYIDTSSSHTKTETPPVVPSPPGAIRRPRLVLSLLGLCGLLLLLCACGRGTTMQDADAVQEFFRTMDGYEAQALIEADFTDRVYNFKVQFDYVKAGTSTIEILEPESVRGVKATIQAGETLLQYDDMSLETGPLPGTGLTPMDALPVMTKIWSEGMLVSTGREKLDGESVLHLSYKTTVGEVEILYHLWVNPDNYYPVKAESFADGRRVITVNFELFSLGVPNGASEAEDAPGTPDGMPEGGAE